MLTQLAAFNSNYDPNWYLSTVVQSTAALIAIIGGFLISRLISLALRRSEMIDHLDNLYLRQLAVESELGTLTETIEAIVHKWFLDRHLETISSNHGGLDLTEILERSNFVGSDLDEITIYANWVAETVKGAWEDIQNLYASKSAPTESQELLTAGLKFQAGDETRIFEHVAEDWNESRKSEMEKRFFPTLSRGLVGLGDRSERPLRLQDERVARRKELIYNLELIESEMNVLNIQQRAGNSPKMLRIGFLTLCYFGCAGILFPLYLMTKNPVHANAPMRMAVFVAFLSGFCALIVFILNAVKNLKTV